MVAILKQLNYRFSQQFYSSRKYMCNKKNIAELLHYFIKHFSNKVNLGKLDIVEIYTKEGIFLELIKSKMCGVTI